MPRFAAVTTLLLAAVMAAGTGALWYGGWLPDLRFPEAASAPSPTQSPEQMQPVERAALAIRAHDVGARATIPRRGRRSGRCRRRRRDSAEQGGAARDAGDRRRSAGGGRRSQPARKERARPAGHRRTGRPPRHARAADAGERRRRNRGSRARVRPTVLRLLPAGNRIPRARLARRRPLSPRSATANRRRRCCRSNPLPQWWDCRSTRPPARPPAPPFDLRACYERRRTGGPAVVARGRRPGHGERFVRGCHHHGQCGWRSAPGVGERRAAPPRPARLSTRARSPALRAR